MFSAGMVSFRGALVAGECDFQLAPKSRNGCITVPFVINTIILNYRKEVEAANSYTNYNTQMKHFWWLSIVLKQNVVQTYM